MKIKKQELLGITGLVRCTLRDIRTGKETIKIYKNLITTAGKVAIARRLINEAALASEGIITYGAVGTNATAPNVADTKLGTEIERKLVSVVSRASNVATIRTYYTTAEGNGALKEFGLFGEAATAAADSGTLFEHASIDITKTNTKTLTIECILTIS